MNKFITNDKELILKSLSHLNVIYKLNLENNNYDDFIKDNIKMDSSIFHLTQVGELCTKFTDIFRNNHPNIKFRDIIGLRNIIVHGYGALHFEDVFDIIKEDVPELMKEYENILKNEYNYSNINNYIENYYNYRKFESINNEEN